MSVILASSSGSVENLNDSVRCGWRPQLRQIDAISLWLTPIRLASSRLDQCVSPVDSSGGVNVAATTIASSTTGRRPERGRSQRPSTPLSRNRSRHFLTVGDDVFNADATCGTVFESPNSITTRARNPITEGTDDDLVSADSSSRSATDNRTSDDERIPHCVSSTPSKST